MKIAVYYDLDRGGAAAALGRFVGWLRRGHEVAVFAARGAHPIVPDVSWIGEAPPEAPRGLYYLNRLAAPRRARALARDESALAARLAPFDRILVHSCRGRGAPALLEMLGGRAAFYVTEPLRLYREPRPDDAVPGILWTGARILYRSTAQRMNAADARHARAARILLANSAYTRERIRSVYGRESSAAEPSIDPFFLESPSRDDGEAFVLSPGALIPQKGHGRVIRALSRWSNPPLLVVAGFRGSAGYRKRISRLAARLGVPLRMVLDPPAEDLRSLYSTARVIAIAAVREPFGLVSLEAQARGGAVAVVDEGGLPETVIDGRTGLVVPVEPEGLAGALRRLWEDPMLRRRLGSAGRERVAVEFPPDRCGARLESLLLAPEAGGSRR